MRTNDLKKLVQTKLKTLTTNVYHEIADENAVYPHIVFTFRRIDLQDLSRQDYILEIDVWDKGTSTTAVDDLADSVENLLQGKNLPQNISFQYQLDNLRKTYPASEVVEDV